MKDFLASTIALFIIASVALGGFVLILICQPLFWFALMVLILAAKL
jgi:hypothetical protein